MTKYLGRVDKHYIVGVAKVDLDDVLVTMPTGGTPVCFFFQAEDGIRDLTVTGVQTCALPIYPQMPEIKLTPEAASRYHIVDYEKYLPFAPGIVLIKAPGHTPGSQMVYVVLASGREYLFIGDIAWHMDGVRNLKGKDAPWIQEDETTLISQLSWLNGLSKSEKNLFIIASHDEEQRLDLIKPGILGS